MKLVNDIVDFLYPRVCVVSENNLHKDNSNEFILDSILKNLRRVSDTQLNELRNKVNSDFTFTVYDFPHKSDFEKIIHHLKYSGMKDLGVFLGKHIAESVQAEIIKQKQNYDLIIPVPLHRTKVRERGYNQSEFIVQGLSNELGVPFVFNLVERKRYTKSQTKLNLKERANNIKDAFSLSVSYKGELKDKNVILLDDVITTGATVNDCIRAIKEARANKIFTVSLAMAE